MNCGNNVKFSAYSVAQDAQDFFERVVHLGELVFREGFMKANADIPCPWLMKNVDQNYFFPHLARFCRTSYEASQIHTEFEHKLCEVGWRC